MKQYVVKVKYEFEGEVLINAESPEEAKNIFKTGFGSPVITGLSSSYDVMISDDGKKHEGINDWEFNTHPTNEKIKSIKFLRKYKTKK